jgi:3-dehydrotetronate 4-kinase
MPGHTLLLGCIADDFTGATDLANNLVRAGMRVEQRFGAPDNDEVTVADANAIVIALKSRTNPAGDAVAQSLAACRWLQAQGAEQIYFKYCSTFDSTSQGNIGPVMDALMDELHCDFTIATPAFPENARSVYMGHLFVGNMLLSESGMRNHPLTPMSDANLARVLQAQSKNKVGLISFDTVAAGADAITAKMQSLKNQQVKIAIVDALRNEDLISLGRALKDVALVTGGSGVAIGLPQNWGIRAQATSAQLPAAQGTRAIISGSCSEASSAQVADFIARGGEAFMIDGAIVLKDATTAPQVLAWAQPRIAEGKTVLIYSTAAPERVRAVQAAAGVAHAGEVIERTLAEIAAGLVQMLGVRQLIVAGGETSGACVASLGIRSVRVGPQIDPGVPWCYAEVAGQGIHIALKSGNFGTVDFFTKAFDLL